MQIAELVATEFFEQGDKERRELNIEPSVSAVCHSCGVPQDPFWVLLVFNLHVRSSGCCHQNTWHLTEGL